MIALFTSNVGRNVVALVIIHTLILASPQSSFNWFLVGEMRQGRRRVERNVVRCDRRADCWMRTPTFYPLRVVRG